MVNATCKLTNLPKDRKNVGCKFHTKRDASGEIVSQKMQALTMRYSQVEFNEIFAPVVKFITIRCILIIRVAIDWDIHQMDIKITFSIKYQKQRSTWINQRGSYKRRNEHLVCKFKKNLYALKQSPRVWYYHIDSFFTNEGFYGSQSEIFRNYCYEWILRYGLGGRCKRPVIHHKVHISYWCWSQFLTMQ